MSDTARALARYTMATARLAPGLYNPASAMDQVLESIQPGLSPKVTAKAEGMIRKGAHPQAALEQALTESYDALYPKKPALSGLGAFIPQYPKSAYPKSAYPKWPQYPQVPQQPALSGLGTTTTTTTRTTTTRPASVARAEAQASRMSGAADMMAGIGSLVESLATAVTGVVESALTQSRARDTEQYERRMGEMNATRQAAEEAALREAEGVALPSVGGIGGGTVLLGVVGLAAASAAVYLVMKKK